MAGQKKTLTVSYGAFSCVLEGFDAPVETMKEVLAYFRALAAEEPSFGTVATRADPALLRRIAEQEFQRQVDVRLEGGALLLRSVGDMQEQPADTTDMVETLVAAEARFAQDVSDAALEKAATPGAADAADRASALAVAEEQHRPAAIDEDAGILDDASACLGPDQVQAGPGAHDPTEEHPVDPLPDAVQTDDGVPDDPQSAAPHSAPHSAPEADTDLRDSIRALLGETGLERDHEAEVIDNLTAIRKSALANRVSKAEAIFAPVTEESDETARRLLEQTQAELSQKDAQRRHDSFEHMRVAVGAARAEEEVTGPRRRDLTTEREIQMYRDAMDVPEPLGKPARPLVHEVGQGAGDRSPLVLSAADRHAALDPLQAQDDRHADDSPAAADHSARHGPEPVAVSPPPTPEAAQPEAPQTAPQSTPMHRRTDPAPENTATSCPMPRRPVLAGSLRHARREVAPDPFVLAPGQRIEPAPGRGTILPRRVQAGGIPALPAQAPDASDADGAAFRDFACKVDAWLLDEQIEAAAAFLAYVRGQALFARGELASLVMAFNDGKTVARDDFLRAFDGVLAAGRLERAEGAFRLCAGSEYAEPAQRYMAR
ncbi:MAG: hypothetical protein ACXIU7_13815 [Roseinatronobacter sp.]